VTFLKNVPIFRTFKKIYGRPRLWGGKDGIHGMWGL
jgi:hypothetical protein